jgi:hypothetical protein
MIKTIKVGEVWVDSGRLCLVDPCYLDGAHSLEESTLDGASATESGGCVMVSSGFGDGIYPVYAAVDESGTVVSVRVDFVCADEGAE